MWYTVCEGDYWIGAAGSRGNEWQVFWMINQVSWVKHWPFKYKMSCQDRQVTEKHRRLKTVQSTKHISAWNTVLKLYWACIRVLYWNITVNKLKMYKNTRNRHIKTRKTNHIIKTPQTSSIPFMPEFSTKIILSREKIIIDVLVKPCKQLYVQPRVIFLALARRDKYIQYIEKNIWKLLSATNTPKLA